MPCKHEGGKDPCVKAGNGHCQVRNYQYNAETTVERATYNDRYIETTKGVAPGAIGAAAEKIVQADLMLRGFEVTQPCSPTALHDLHVELPSVGWMGVQVKAVRVNTKTGDWYVHRTREERTAKRSIRRSPIYALVRSSTKEIRYEAGSEPLPDELK